MMRANEPSAAFRLASLFAPALALGCLFAVWSGAAAADQTMTAGALPLQAKVVELTDRARDKFGMPAATVLVIDDGKVVARYSVGERVTGSGIKVTDADLWHIGSCGKALTAAMILRLVDRGILDLDKPLAALLPRDLVELTHPVLREATLLQLLNHTAGLPELDTGDEAAKPDAARFGNVVDGEARAALQAAVPALRGAPEGFPGERFRYSNWGYIVAGIAAAHATGKPWSTLMREEVFIPLGMAQAGFGPPASGVAPNISQPWGHDRVKRFFLFERLVAMAPDRGDAELPRVFAPAGLMHLSIDDWAKFNVMLLDGFNGKSTFLSKRAFERFFTPAVTANVPPHYALGIGLLKDAGGRVRVLTHTGSNGFWRADFRIFPGENRIYLMAANAGFDEVDSAFSDIRSELNNVLRRK